jgi:predicted TPR repeat methyltransferase
MSNSNINDPESVPQEGIPPQIGPEARLADSIRLASDGNLAAAEARVRALLMEHPKLLPARLHLARVLLALDRPVEAAFELEQFLVDPQLGTAEELQVKLLAAETALRTKQLTKAESYYRRALTLAPRNAQAMFGVAMVCQQINRLEEALRLLEGGLRVEPNATHALVNKGLVEKQMGQLDAAVASFTRALSINPAIAQAHYSLGLIHLLKGRTNEAEQSFRNVLALSPGHAHATMQLATLLRHENKIDEAAEVYRAVLRIDPSNTSARFYLDSLVQKDSLDRVPAEVALAIYADESVGRNLEASLRSHLHYQTPAILQATLQEVHGAERNVLDILDLGCGSGLFGALLKPRAKRLVGVDLSAAMLKECQRKGIYDELHAQDIVDYLTEATCSFDLIVAMDVFCFFGNLRELIQMCAMILRPGGMLAFSVEKNTDNQPWQFHPSRQFLHSAVHLLEASAAAGLHEVRVTESVLRRELDEDRPGFVALFARTD